VTDPIPVGDDDLEAFVDRRLPPERHAAVKAYLDAHPDVAARAEQYVAQQDLLADSLRRVFEEPIPARLRVANILAQRRRARLTTLNRAAAVVLLISVGAAAGWFARGMGGQEPPLSAAGENALAAFRTYSVEVRHPVEVRAADEPHLVQWLSNRVQQHLTPPDLSSEGFRLMGGRVLPTSGSPAALLMYDDDRGTRLTVYAQAVSTDGTDFRVQQNSDVATVTWAERPFALALTAHLPSDRMLQLARKVREQFAASAGEQSSDN
jgi:anti-sigma factor RsiW